MIAYGISSSQEMEILKIFVSPLHNYVGHHGQPPGSSPVQEVTRAECLAGRGISGDRFCNHKPDYKGQITFFAFETYESLCHECGVRNRPASVFRRNVLTQGKDLNELIGEEFEIQGVRFLGVEECRPCYWMNSAFHPEAEARLQGHGGLRAQILTSGWIETLANARIVETCLMQY
jgi:MOSC domain-containing protein YiiM